MGRVELHPCGWGRPAVVHHRRERVVTCGRRPKEVERLLTLSAHAPMHMRTRDKRRSVAARGLIGAGVTVAVPATGLIAASSSAVATPGDVSTNRPTLYQGMTGNSVRVVQTKLGVPTTGYFGTQTNAAVKRFQARQGLVADGIVGRLTWAKLDGVSSSGTRSTSASPRRALLYFGLRGDDVRLLQAKLGIRQTGTFDAATLSAVKLFQQRNGLAVDGYVGPLTWAKLDASAASSTTTRPATTTPSSSSATGAQTGTPLACADNAVTLAYGSSGQLVKVLQSRVNVNVDGFFGPDTKAAVQSLQSRSGLVPDGIVGPLTWAKLGCSSTTPAPAPTTPTTPSATRDQVISIAKRYVGTPYLWGGSTPAGFDCSGFTAYVFNQVGVSFPRTAAQQQAYFPGTTQPQPGDLLFFGAPAYHVAIYLGNGLMIDSPHPGGTVDVRTIYQTPTSYARVLN